VRKCITLRRFLMHLRIFGVADSLGTVRGQHGNP